MHFEILIEDESGKIALDSILAKILGPNGGDHTYKLHAYKGIGRLPKNLRGITDPQRRILLDRLPRILSGYGKSLKGLTAAVIVIVDLDNRDCKAFKSELTAILDQCNPAPTTLFRIAIEEVEAWLLGDRSAIKAAYPKSKDNVLDSYAQDSICGTWERMADAVYPGGSAALRKLGWPHIGETKCEWAKNIAPYITIDQNRSKSFQVFHNGLRRLTGKDGL